MFQENVMNLNHINRITGRTIMYLFLVLFAAVFAFPFYYVFVIASWKSKEFFQMPPRIFFGDGWLENWEILFNKIAFWRNLLTSIGIATLSTAATIFFCTMGGFAFARYDFKGKETLFKIMLITFAIPATLNIVPFFKIIKVLHMYGTWLPLIVPGMANAFGIFLMTQYIKTSVPPDLLDAARIDGMNEFGILLRIGFPLARPGISILGMLTFIGSWNSFLFAYIMLPKLEDTTMPVAIMTLSAKANIAVGPMMLGNVIALLPLSIILILFSKHIISDLTAGSVKG